MIEVNGNTAYEQAKGRRLCLRIDYLSACLLIHSVLLVWLHCLKPSICINQSHRKKP